MAVLAFTFVTLLAATVQGVALPQTAMTETTATTTASACAQVSSHWAKEAEASPSASFWKLPYEAAYECHQSVPLVKQDALDLVDGLTAATEWQSTLVFLKEPPEDYGYQSVDLLGGLAKIRQNVQDETYGGEIAFEQDIVNLYYEAHDGHLGFSADGWSIFTYVRGGPLLTSVMLEGESWPDIYAYEDVALSFNDSSFKPSPVRLLNGQNATELIMGLGEKGTGYQDPHAEWNSFFYTVANNQPIWNIAVHGYPGNETEYTFANGTVISYENFAATMSNLTGVVDGASFYSTFCDADNKELGEGNENVGGNPSTFELYPTPYMELSDYTMAGWFFNDSSDYDQVAVLAVRAFSTGVKPDDFPKALKKFFDHCRETNKTHLIIDLSDNPGGVIQTGYELFKQLFPTLQLYSTGNMRASDQLNIMGEYFTPWSHNHTDDQAQYLNTVESVPFDGTDYLNASGTNFASWQEFYGPVAVHGGNFTNLNRYNLNTSDYEDAQTFKLSGYKGNMHVEPQPFNNTNIIILVDGLCSSTCHTFSHLARYQAKVKTIAVGGISNTTGSMEYVGGVKGKQAMFSRIIAGDTQIFYDLADNTTKAEANKTMLKTMLEQGNYTVLRTSDFLGLRFNLQNDIAQQDYAFTPLQFKSEAADCRLWNTAPMIQNITNLWHAVADQAFGFGGTDVFSGCVQGSTDQPSSLSGNATLWNDGQMQNVTTFVYPPAGEVDVVVSDSSAESEGSSKSTSTSGASMAVQQRTWEVSLWLGLAVVVLGFF